MISAEEILAAVFVRMEKQIYQMGTGDKPIQILPFDQQPASVMARDC
jgi:hypothetical protein